MKMAKHVFGTAHLNPHKTGLPVDIWSDNQGILREVSHRGTPNVEIGWLGCKSVCVTISSTPEVLTSIRRFSMEEMGAIAQEIQYVAENYDIFLKHYLNTEYSFDDEDMFNALRARGVYR